MTCRKSLLVAGSGPIGGLVWEAADSISPATTLIFAGALKVRDIGPKT